MKRTYLLLLLLFMYWMYASAQQVQTAQEPADSVKNVAYIDSLYRELPEVMITGERPVVKAEQGKLVYDVPRLVGSLPVDNAYDAVKNLPGVVSMNDALTLGGQPVTVVINGKVTTLSVEQLSNLLKSMPVSRIEKAEVMYSAPARYQGARTDDQSDTDFGHGKRTFSSGRTIYRLQPITLRISGRACEPSILRTQIFC